MVWPDGRGLRLEYDDGSGTYRIVWCYDPGVMYIVEGSSADRAAYNFYFSLPM